MNDELIETPGRGRILYADDEAACLATFSNRLKKAGYECVTALDGLIAANLLGEQEFDCLISDIHMLGNTKLEFIRVVKEKHPGLPVILVTAYPSMDTAVEAFGLPVVSYLVKPFLPAALLSAVEAAVCRAQLLRQFDTTRRNLENWLGEVNQLAAGLRAAPRLPASGQMDSYLMITYRNTLEALLGLKSVMEMSLSVNPGSAARPGSGPSPLLLIEALHNAIGTLEKTKDAFRSKELGALRRQLENLLGAASRQTAA
jgi:CheY-like chemotaxis protein